MIYKITKSSTQIGWKFGALIVLYVIANYLIASRFDLNKSKNSIKMHIDNILIRKFTKKLMYLIKIRINRKYYKPFQASQN